jgi:hypothetical protein
MRLDSELIFAIGCLVFVLVGVVWKPRTIRWIE